MAMHTRPTKRPEAIDAAGFRRYTIDEYHDLIRTGYFHEGEAIELIEGFLVNKMPRNAPHDAKLSKMLRQLLRVLPDTWTPRGQSAVTLGDSEPEPDYAVVKTKDDDYESGHPGPADIGLVIEISDSSLTFDRREKSRVYARAGVPVYWIVNVPDKVVEVLSVPDPDAEPPRFTTSTVHKVGESVSVTLAGVTVGSIPVAALFT